MRNDTHGLANLDARVALLVEQLIEIEVVRSVHDSRPTFKFFNLSVTTTWRPGRYLLSIQGHKYRQTALNGRTMGARHTAGLLFLASFLLTGVLFSNLLVGVDRTALDADFVKETLDEERLYDTVIRQVGDQLRNQTGEEIPFDIEDILTREYIRAQTEANIDSIYAYLHSRNDSLIIGIDISPLKDRLAQEIDREIRDQRLADLDPQLARMIANESAYRAERASFRQEQLDRIQQATDQELSQAELEAAYDQRKDTIRETLLNRTAEEVSDSTAIQEATREILRLKVDGLLNESLTYDAFMTEFNASLDRLATAQAERMTARMKDNVPQNVNVTAELDQKERERLEMAQKAVSVLGLLALIVPLLTVGIAGLMWVLAGSRAGALLAIGHTTALGGLIGAGLVTAMKHLVVPDIQQMMASQAPGGATDIGIGVLEQFLGVFMTQSVAILVLGLIILAAGIIMWRRERADQVDESSHGDAAESQDGLQDTASTDPTGTEEAETNGRDSKTG